ncbi:FkbM family methyltransferase [Phaeospirillum tilakii]|uniref:FkbM family methyltransferase n=1 Tax=Phaeospirillum tilakii TaxID=741673 RepID=A0ABW5CAK6_9PROT
MSDLSFAPSPPAPAPALPLLTSDDVVARMKALPNVRCIVTRVDPAEAVVVVLPRNLDLATRFYATTHTVPPRILPLEPGIELGGKIPCLFSNGDLWGEGGYAPTFLRALELGIAAEVQIDYAAIQPVLRFFISTQPFPAQFVIDNIERITRCCNALADQHSRDVFLGGIKYRLTGDSGFMPFSNLHQYFHEQVQVAPGDFVYEAGISTGGEDLTIEFSKSVGPLGRVYAFEADLAVIDPLATALAPRHNVRLEPVGLWSEAATLPFNHGEHGDSRVLRQGEGNAVCSLISLDSHVAAQPEQRCDFIKFDIEGAEPEALRGSVETLRRLRPKLAISVYHEPFEQFVEILDYLVNLDLGYRFYLSHHAPYRYETILYGQPPAA